MEELGKMIWGREIERKKTHLYNEKNSVSLKNLENKLAHLEKLQTCRGGKLDKRNKDLYPNIHRRTKSANAHSKVLKLLKKRKRENVLWDY